MIDDNAIVRVLRREFPDSAAIYRFGSTAENSAGSDSDIDLAILPDGPIDAMRRFGVQESLAAELHRNVDLIDLAAASTVLRMQVVAKGQVLATFDPAKQSVFEDYVFSSYARLNEERREILQRIKAEGRVYGG
ncbi:MAG: nucleotidyltransferase family protein [Candidatus Binatia bacterium]